MIKKKVDGNLFKMVQLKLNKNKRTFHEYDVGIFIIIFGIEHR